MSNSDFCPLIIICPGIHDLQLTQDFLKKLQLSKNNNQFSSKATQVLIFPTQDYPAYSAIDVVEFLKCQITNIKSPIAFISFSAGVVGAIGAAWGWQLLGGNVKTLIAIDGWGVPLSGNFPIHRLSHDYFTHWSSALLGAGEDSFYADPAVDHLDLWESPDTCRGWWMHPAARGKSEQRTYTTAAEFLIHLLQKYLE
jgi:hypothetical protein